MPAGRESRMLLCFSDDPPPVAAEVATALRAAGHTAEVTMEERSTMTALVFELAINPKGTRVLVRVGEDFRAGTDVATSDWEIAWDLVNLGVLEARKEPLVRRLVHLGWWDHADAGAVRALVGFLCERMRGREVSEEGPCA